jgi:hypothetical protein
MPPPFPRHGGGFVRIFLVIRAIFASLRRRPPQPPPPIQTPPAVPIHSIELSPETNDCVKTVLKGLLTRELGNIIEFTVRHIISGFTCPH